LWCLVREIGEDASSSSLIETSDAGVGVTVVGLIVTDLFVVREIISILIGLLMEAGLVWWGWFWQKLPEVPVKISKF